MPAVTRALRWARGIATLQADQAIQSSAPGREKSEPPHRSSASNVATGILSSRIVGLVRESTIAYFLGVSGHADVLHAAFRAPNILQNLLGEGTISAAFIPIYGRMLEEGRQKEAGRFAGAILGLLFVVGASLALLGVVFAEPIVTVLTYGFLGDAASVAAGQTTVDRFPLTVLAVRIIFPMTGILVLSAWALGILNSHRRFFLPYVAPVLWNIAIIAALFATAYWIFGARAGDFTSEELNGLVLAGCMGGLTGALLQFLVQLPLVVRVMSHFRLSFSFRVEGVRDAVRAFGPAVAGRGVYQLSAYLDLFLASFLMQGALGALRYSQILYMLPVSLFGLSVAASELPELSRIRGGAGPEMYARVSQSLRQMLFLVIPTVFGYLAFGYLAVAALYQRGNFGIAESWQVYFVLTAYTVGLTATTASRLLQNTFYALRDTRTPAKIAFVRVVVSTAVAVPAMFALDTFQVSDIVGVAGNSIYLGAVGLAIGSAVGAWVELWQLGRHLRRRLVRFPFPWMRALRLLGLSMLASVPAILIWLMLPQWSPVIMAVIVIGCYALVYLVTAYVVGFAELSVWTGRMFKR